MRAVEDDRTLGIKVMKLSRLLRLRFDRRARALGLTRAQWQTIACVRRQPGATQRQVAELLEVGEVTVGRSIDKLVEAGWVERRADPPDRRAHRLWLTAAIEPLIGELTRIGEAEEAAALAGLGAAERAALHAMLDRIAANLDGDAVEGPACGPEDQDSGAR
ncbi:MAG TPA: MarR family winged helix-turn-helix transcriptional regulator [Sphingopyxis sp.]|nr:MarR family winged helix-turn-helix transcriptional regulator [Sphingopyxis sp.]